MPIRNPFKKSATALEVHDPNTPRDVTEKGFQQVNVTGTKPVDIKEPAEYKLSEIDNSGAYLPPSPPAKERSFFSRSSTSTSYSTHRSIQNENEPFNISRESFDSYRRSFDISARAPISIYDTPPRQSLDSRRLHSRSSRPSFDTRLDRPHAVEEGFEEVGLNDEAKPKKRGLFARFSDHTESSGLASPDAKHASNHHNFLFTGRKRGQSGQGNELRSMSQPGGRNAVEVGAD